MEYINNIGAGGRGDCNGRGGETGASLPGKNFWNSVNVIPFVKQVILIPCT